MIVEVFGEEMSLLPQRAIHWKKHDILLLADLHLGKIGHFRRAGIAVPNKANDRNIEVMVELVQLTKPKRIICLGDLFHSHYNPEWEVFGELVRHFNHITFELVMGNHDIMSEIQYQRKGLVVHAELIIDKFLFTHHPLNDEDARLYNIAGHIHPGVNLRGKGLQSVTLPCFYFGSNQAYMPAFGSFTGLAKIRPKKQDRIFVIADDRIMFVS